VTAILGEARIASKVVRILFNPIRCVNELCFSSHGFLRYDAVEALVPAASLNVPPTCRMFWPTSERVNFSSCTAFVWMLA